MSTEDEVDPPIRIAAVGVLTGQNEYRTSVPIEDTFGDDAADRRHGSSRSPDSLNKSGLKLKFPSSQ